LFFDTSFLQVVPHLHNLQIQKQVKKQQRMTENCLRICKLTWSNIQQHINLNCLMLLNEMFPMIVANLRHTYAITMLSKSASWYLTPVSWIDHLSKGEVLTNTDLDRFGNNFWEKQLFCKHRKSHIFEFSSWKMGVKNKNVAFIILFSVFNSIIDATAMTLLYENWTELFPPGLLYRWNNLIITMYWINT